MLEFTESESESDNDMLKITIENNLFGASPKHQEYITPDKLQQLKQVPQFISPLAKTPTIAAATITQTLKTSLKHTHRTYTSTQMKQIQTS